MFAALLGSLPPAAASAQTHVDNPFSGATMYVNPDYTAKVNAQANQTTDTALANKMRQVGGTATAVWLDRIAAIAGASGATGLEGHLNNAVAQRQGNTPIVFLVVIYDLPGRDCAALASNGELPLTQQGLTRYRTDYIDPIVSLMGRPAYSNVRIVAVVEPDSLPNLVTNLGDPECSQANSSGIYASAIQYALNQLHAIPNVYTYLDIGHSGWVGWPNNASGVVTLYNTVALGTTAGRASVDGFVTNTANTTPLREPFMTATQQVGGQQVMSSSFYEWNPNIDEVSVTADLYSRFIGAGWSSNLGFLIDTSRNGWGGSGRPTAASTSTVLNTFVQQSKIDRRQHRGLWCNPNGAGLGELPQASPPGFPNSHLDAFVWVKPPGDSDGSSTLIPNNEGKGFDRMCDPTFTTQYGVLTNALPNAPLSGQWFEAQFRQLVENAFPPIGGGGVCTLPPPALTGLSASAVSSSQINLSWTAAPPPAACAITYNVYRSTSSGFTPSPANRVAQGLTTTSFQNTGLNASTTYFFVVEVVDAAGTTAGATSAITLGAGSCTATPPAVSGLTASAISSSQINLSWGAVTPPPNCTVSYNVYRSTSPGFTPSASNLVASGVATNSFSNTGLAASTAYFFAVTSVDSAGASGAASANATTQGSTGGGGCHVTYASNGQWPGGFGANITLENTSATAWTSWTLTFTFPSGQQVTNLWNGAVTQNGASVTVTNLGYNGNVPAGGNYTGLGFNGSWTTANTPPSSFSVNGTPCN